MIDNELKNTVQGLSKQGEHSQPSSIFNISASV